MNNTEEIVHIIIPPGSVPDVLKQIGAIYLRDCVCRVRENHCPPEKWEVCLLTENAPQDDLDGARLISHDEARKLFQRNNQSNLIFTLFFSEQEKIWTELCSCCTCCCSPIQNKVKEANYTEYLRSAYVAITDEARCMLCGTCIPACPFDARNIDSGYMKFTENRCFGCGRCIRECSEEAILLIEDPNRGISIPSMN